MYCENRFCIYWSDQACILDEISLDIQGSCQQCIYVDMEEEFLKTYREKFLKHYEAQ